MELIINTDLETSLPATIDFNYEQLKLELSKSLQKYQNIVVTEDTIPLAKNDRATLRKLSEAVDNKRKMVKKACLAPYEDFERKAKELMAMIDEPIIAIDQQVKAFEEAKKQAKHSALLQFYRSNIKSLVDLLPFEKVLPEKWANTAMTVKKLNEEMLQRIEKARNDIKIIQAMDLPYTEQMLSVYLDTLDMGAALAEKKRFEEQQKALEAVKMREAEAELMEAAKRRTEVSATPAPPDFSKLKPGDVVSFEGATVSGDSPARQLEQTVNVIDFRVYATDEQLKALAAFMKSNGIRYGRVPTDNGERKVN